MEIRRATPAQWRESRDIRLRALADSPDAFLSTLERESGLDEETWKSRLDRTYTVFAWQGQQVVGTATGKPDPHEEGGREIVGMWVDPAHRRSGVATALVHELVRWARAEGAGSVALWFVEGNDRARRLYEECGFALTGEREVMRPGLDEFRMRLPLE